MGIDESYSLEPFFFYENCHFKFKNAPKRHFIDTDISTKEVNFSVALVCLSVCCITSSYSIVPI